MSGLIERGGYLEVIQVVHTRLARRGDGVETPVRVIDQFWTMDGDLLAEVDPCPDLDDTLQYTNLLERLRVIAQTEARLANKSEQAAVAMKHDYAAKVIDDLLSRLAS